MKKGIVIALAVAGAMMVGGVAIGTVAACTTHFDMKDMWEAKADMKYIEKTYDITESFNDIRVEKAQIKFLPSTDGKTTVDVKENEKYYFDVNVSGDTLCIKSIDERTWMDNVGILNTWPYVTVYLPEEKYGKLNIANESDGVVVEGKYGFESVDINTSSGSIVFTSDVDGNLVLLSHSGAVRATEVSSSGTRIEATSGSVKVNNIKTGDLSITSTSGYVSLEDAEAGDIKISTSSGSTTVERINAKSISAEGDSGSFKLKTADVSGDINVARSSGSTGFEKVNAKNIYAKGTSGYVSFEDTVAENVFNAETTSGSIKLNGCDGQNMTLTGHSGYIGAELLSNKDIRSSSSSGSISLPDSNAGEINGKLDVSTTSGSIKISIK